MGQDVSRRGFLKAAGTAAGAAWLAAHWPAALAAAADARKAQSTRAAFKALKPEEAADLAAIAAQILPTDDLPGATEAGAIYFIDAALATFMAEAAGGIREGLAALNAQAPARFGALAPDEQVALLKVNDATPFFQLVHFLTLAGTFALASYGGNRNDAGWKILGFEPRHFWQPPFGHYDAKAKEGTS